MSFGLFSARVGGDGLIDGIKVSAQIKHIQDFLNTALKNTGFYYINNNQ